jgi:thiamine-phosphate pyrophosphorylase
LSTPSARTGHWGLGERRLYVCAPDRPDLEHFVEACIEGGVDVVQLREKRLPDNQLIERARRAQRVCTDHHVPFILNDRPDLAAALGADGVHVGQQDLSPIEARRLMGDDAIIGLSTHEVDELEVALGRQRPLGEPGGSDAPSASGANGGCAPVDYISAGPVTPTPTKPGRAGTGLGYIGEAVRRAPWPVWVTGGVNPTTVIDMVTAGARHFVVVRWLTEASDPKASARMLRQSIDESIGGASP